MIRDFRRTMWSVGDTVHVSCLVNGTRSTFLNATIRHIRSRTVQFLPSSGEFTITCRRQDEPRVVPVKAAAWNDGQPIDLSDGMPWEFLEGRAANITTARESAGQDQNMRIEYDVTRVSSAVPEPSYVGEERHQREFYSRPLGRHCPASDPCERASANLDCIFTCAYYGYNDSGNCPTCLRTGGWHERSCVMRETSHCI